jgi:photosystem II stability/assembly factor-like uncharacterized protein
MKNSSLLAVLALCFHILYGQNTIVLRDENGFKPRQPFTKVADSFPGKGGNPWEPIGPYGGDVLDMAVSPVDIEIVLAAAGIPYRSSDGGQTWSVIESLLTLSPSGISTFEASSDGAFYAAGPYTYNKIFKSTDNGVTWSQKFIPVNTSGLDIAIDPANSSIIYVGLTSLIGSATNNVIVKSVNGGDDWTWFDMTSVLPVGYSVVSLAVDPGDSMIIFAIGNEGFSNAIVAATFDGGSTWENRTGNLPVGKPLNFLAISDQKVFIAGGQLFGGQVVGVYKTENYGTNWQNISTSFPNKVSNAILIDPTDTDKMYVASEGDGIYYTTDGGSNWTFSTNGAGDNGAARCLVFEPGNTDAIYAGFLSLGVCKSTDASLSWELTNHGIATLLTNDIEVDPNNSSRILVAFEAENSGGCYLSDNGGEDWSLVEGLPGTRFSKVGFSIDGAMYAWSNGPSSVAQEGLYKSADNGITWDNKGPNIGGLFETEIFALAISGYDPDLIFIGGNNFGVNGWESMIYRTQDAAESWENVYMGLDYESFRYLFIDPGSSDQIVYGAYNTTNDHAGFIKSTDNGSNWTDINSGIPAINRWSGAIVTDPADPAVVFGGAGGYGEMNGTVFKSIDGGASWLPTSLSLPIYSRINDFLISPVNSSVVYAATSHNGVFISTDAGNSWEPANDSLVALNLTAFSRPFVNTDSTWLFCVSSFSNSCFMSEIYDPATPVIESPRIQTNSWIISNPSPGKCRLTAELKTASSIEIKVFDELGRLYQDMADKTGSGRYSCEISLKPGIWFIRIQTDQEGTSLKILIR